MDDLEFEIRKVVLDNAVKYEGKPEVKSVMGALLGSRAELRSCAGEVKGIVQKLVTEIEKMSVDDQISELKEIASLLEGKKVKEGVRFLVAASNSTYALAKDAGYADIIEKAGCVVSNCCAAPANPLLFLDGARVVATNSSRGAHYMQMVTEGKTKTWCGDVKDCINSAITGKWGA